MNHVYKYTQWQSIVGPMSLYSQNEHIIQIVLPGDKPIKLIEKASSCLSDDNDEVLINAKNQIDLFLIGKLTQLNFKVELNGTEFQKKVWHEVSKIPFNQTRSYKEIAEAIQKPLAVRAVGGAIGKNPLPLFIPCHRVIGSSGKLVGFLFGLSIKKQLLNIEATHKLI